MTKRLILMRHAKSGWDNAFADDHGRTLTDRGETAAIAIGRWLCTNNYIPDVILTSDAMRTLQTTTLIKQGIGKQIDTQEVALLYHAAPDTIREIASKTAGQTIAIVGHNPGIAMAAHLLATYAPDHHRFDDYPTCATTVIDFADDDWLKPGKGTVVDFTVPRDL